MNVNSCSYAQNGQREIYLGKIFGGRILGGRWLVVAMRRMEKVKFKYTSSIRLPSF